jgi:hypothetical protein
MRMSSNRTSGISAMALAVTIGAVQAADEDDVGGSWSEEQVVPPAFPRQGDLVELFAGTGASNRFFVDGRSLSVGKDGVVRYVLVVKTSGGATNVTFEGIRCKTGEQKVLALARSDGTWTPARIADWRRIEDKLANRHHAVLSRELFCPFASPIRTADEGRDALRRGKHPSLP